MGHKIQHAERPAEQHEKATAVGVCRKRKRGGRKEEEEGGRH